VHTELGLETAKINGNLNGPILSKAQAARPGKINKIVRPERPALSLSVSQKVPAFQALQIVLTVSQAWRPGL
jgi:hypothetical protein